MAMPMPASVQAWTFALSAALLHLVWQAGLVAAVVVLAQARWRAMPASRRYVWNCLALFSLPAMFVATLLWVHAGGVNAAAAAWTPWGASAASAWMPYLAASWMLGVAAMGVRALGGWVWLRRARREVVGQLDGCGPDVWQRARARVQARLGGAAAVSLGVSRRVLGPCVLGWWRPLILLPASALAGVDPAQAEALLAHELAHILRRDYLINVAQRAIEAVFFYHPAVWWLSAQVTQERENCCDDAAIAACGDAVGYARALVEFAGAAGAPRVELACAAHGGALRPRVLRILGLPNRSAGARAWVRMSAAAAMAGALLGAGVWLHAPVARSAVPDAVAHLAVPPRAMAGLIPAVPRFVPPAVTPEAPETPAPASADLTAPVVPARQTEVVAFTLAAVESCTPQWQWVRYTAPDGKVWIGLEPVMSCVPVLQPTEVWLSSL
jgi:beta-lactamase regulating signal transducer with metallopeptidase domain